MHKPVTVTFTLSQVSWYFNSLLSRRDDRSDDGKHHHFTYITWISFLPFLHSFDWTLQAQKLKQEYEKNLTHPINEKEQGEEKCCLTFLIPKMSNSIISTQSPPLMIFQNSQQIFNVDKTHKMHTDTEHQHHSLKGSLFFFSSSLSLCFFF